MVEEALPTPVVVLTTLGRLLPALELTICLMAVIDSPPGSLDQSRQLTTNKVIPGIKEP